MANNLQFSPLKISSCTIGFSLNTRVDLDKLFEKFVLDNRILGIKYNNKHRGIISLTNTFYNQATFNCWFDQNATVKMFINGNCHISGALSEEKGKYIIEYIINVCKNIKGYSEIAVKCENGVVYDAYDLDHFKDETEIITKSLPNYPIKIYGANEDNVFFRLGCKRKDVFFINNIKMKLFKTPETHVWLSKTCNVGIYTAYDTLGNKIGEVKDFLIQKYKTDSTSKYIQVVDGNKILFYDKRQNLKGERIMFFDKTPIVPKENLENIEVYYKCFDTENIVITKDFMNVNYIFNIGMKINKVNLDIILREHYGIETIFSITTKTANVVSLFVYDANGNIVKNGVKTEKNDVRSAKVIFYTVGKVIIHASCTKIVNQCIMDIKNIISKHIDVIRFETINRVQNSKISVYDIL